MDVLKGAFISQGSHIILEWLTLMLACTFIVITLILVIGSYCMTKFDGFASIYCKQILIRMICKISCFIFILSYILDVIS